MRDTLVTIPGVSNVDVDFTRALAVLSVDTKKTSPDQVTKELAKRTYQRYTATVKKLER